MLLIHIVIYCVLSVLCASAQLSQWPCVVGTAAAKPLQLCPTLCNPIDSSPSGSPVPGILQARTLEWVAISFSNAWKWKVKVKSLSHVWLLATPWTAAYQAPLSMGFSRQEYWSGLPLLSLVVGTIMPFYRKENRASQWGHGRFGIWSQLCSESLGQITSPGVLWPSVQSHEGLRASCQCI